MAPGGTNPTGPKPLIEGKQGNVALVTLWAFVTIPLAALAVAIWETWGQGFSWIDAILFASFYSVGTFGIGGGFHRYFTHGSFKAKRWVRIALAIAGSFGVEGGPIQWVADHRRHHQFSDMEGDPHSPWRYGGTAWGLTKGLLYSHIGWLFHKELSNRARFAPDLVADEDIVKVDKRFQALVAVSIFSPAIIGGLVTWSWQGALTAFLWAGLVRIGLLHHITWSINSICHVYGEKPFDSRDKATNFWPLALISFGESWHNSHHADPTCARHGVERGQIDINARLIWVFERLGWVSNVRWPKKERFDKLRREPTTK